MSHLFAFGSWNRTNLQPSYAIATLQKTGGTENRSRPGREVLLIRGPSAEMLKVHPGSSYEIRESQASGSTILLKSGDTEGRVQLVAEYCNNSVVLQEITVSHHLDWLL